MQSLSVLVMVILVWGCSAMAEVSGEIDAKYLAAIRSNLDRGEEIVLSSYGGDPEIAAQVATLIESSTVESALGDLCLSACAEFLLPTRAGRRFAGRPLIGFHGNDRIAQWLSGPGHNTCGADRVAQQAALFKKYGLRQSFWKETALRLMVIGQTNEIVEGCASVNMQSEAGMWFPTTDQFKFYLNYNPPGPLCADEEQCWRGAVVGIINPGQRFVVGDNIFYMNPDRQIEPIARSQFSREYLIPSR